ncbi:MAG: hypothetical protein ACFFDI_16955 [Promethearchaeota archaeon]
MISNSLLAKPIVLVGKYYDAVETLLREHIQLLRPKLIWVEYRTIPVLYIARVLRNHQLSDQLYFLEISTLESLDQLLKSSVLLSIFKQGFSTLIINIPRFYSFPIDFNIRYQELMRKINIILIMDELKLPKTQVDLIHGELENFN